MHLIMESLRELLYIPAYNKTVHVVTRLKKAFLKKLFLK